MAALNLFGQYTRQIHAIAFAGQIAVIYPGGMSEYYATYNKWYKKAAISNFQSGASCDLFIWDGELSVRLADKSGLNEYKYVAPENKWVASTVRFIKL